jgi:hypothetical protein
MSRWRRFHYSASLAVTIVALALLGVRYFSDNFIGYFISYVICFLILLPGGFASVVLESLLSRLVTDGGYYVQPSYAVPVLAACAHCVFFYMVLQAWVESREGGGAR